MKKLFCFIISTFVITFLSSTLFSQSVPFKDRFHLSTFTDPHIIDFYNQNAINKYTDLSYNLITGLSCVPSDYDVHPCKFWGGFFDPVSSYENNIKTMLDAFQSATNFGNKSVMTIREKIFRSSYGQRSTYYAKYEPDVVPTLVPGYGFTGNAPELITGRVITDNPYFGGRQVKVCQVGIDDADKYIVYDLYENMEQVNFAPTGSLDPYNRNFAYYLSDKKQSPYRWFVNPCMRIDSVFAKNPINIDNNFSLYNEKKSGYN